MMKLIKNSYILLLTSLLTTLCWSNNAAAEVANPVDPGWHFLIAPYLWATSIQGDVTVKGYSSDFTVAFQDIMKHLDFAAEGHVEAGYGPWTLMLDPTYLRVSEARDKGPIRPRVTTQTTLVDTGLFYSFYSTQLACDQYETMELFVGTRHFSVDNTLDFSVAPSISSSEGFTVPIVGARLKFDITPQTHFWLRGDDSFSHSDEVEKTWSATTGLSYSFTRNFEVGIAYRVLKIDFEKHTNDTDVILYGPMLGVGFTF